MTNGTRESLSHSPSPELTGEQKPKRRRHKGLWIFLIIVIVLVVGAVVFIGMSGVVQVPVLSGLFGTNKPKDLGVKYGPQYIASLQTKVPVTIEGGREKFVLFSNNTYSGSMPIDQRITQEEVTSLVRAKLNSLVPLKDIQVKMIEGGFEISGMADQYIKAPVYGKIMVEKTSSNTVNITVAKAKGGLFSVPQTYLDQASKIITGVINNRLAQIPNLSFETLEYHDGYSIVKGTMPSTIVPGTGSWVDVGSSIEKYK